MSKLLIRHVFSQGMRILPLAWLLWAPLYNYPGANHYFPLPTWAAVVMPSDPVTRDNVRSELVELQARDGLAIAEYDSHGLRIVDFEKRKAILGKPFPDYRAQGGTVSSDGSRIAFTLKSLTQSPPWVLGIMRTDNSDLREITSVRNPVEMCWSRDMARIAMGAVDTKSKTLQLTVVTFATESAKELSSNMGRLTTQCWSPDGKEVVFESADNVVIENVDGGNQRALAVGKAPTWSPDGNWIAFFDKRDRSYYAIHPSGEGKKKLFHQRAAVAGLYWSPDSRIVAYVVEIGGLVSLEAYKLYVRRLEDGSEDWVEDADLGCCGDLQWINNKGLLTQLESGTSIK
jgi:dipeptidyl aminopeptidase/acylaminoacyl peptidase